MEHCSHSPPSKFFLFVYFPFVFDTFSHNDKRSEYLLLYHVVAKNTKKHRVTLITTNLHAREMVIFKELPSKKQSETLWPKSRRARGINVLVTRRGQWRRTRRTYFGHRQGDNNTENSHQEDIKSRRHLLVRLRWRNDDSRCLCGTEMTKNTVRRRLRLW